MAKTSISDIIVPEVWLPMTINRTVTISELVTSGIIAATPEFDALANREGKTVEMPFWEDITGNSEVLSDAGSLTPQKLSTGQDRAVKLLRGKAWQHSDLVRFLAGSDPAQAIGNMVGDWWARDMQTTTLSVLKGVFAAASMSGHLKAIHKTTGGAGAQTADNCLNAETFIDSTQLLGDHKASLTAIIMHSAVEASLRKLDLIDFVPASEQGKVIRMFQGHQVIVDDGMPTATVDSSTVYTTYLFGRGAIALGVGGVNDPAEGGFGTYGAEMFRDPLGSTSGIITRRNLILHPRGVKWAEPTVAGSSPTNAEMEASDAWVRVFDPKSIAIVKITHNILP